jgi:hypothetical protein
MWYDVAALVVFVLCVTLITDIDIRKVKGWINIAGCLVMAVYILAYPCYVLVSLAYWIFK